MSVGSSGTARAGAANRTADNAIAAMDLKYMI
jgi:hypothetical protein